MNTRSLSCVWQILSAGCLAAALVACGPSDPRELAAQRATIETGVFGAVLWLEGNHMPGASGGSTEAVANREVRVYRVATKADAVQVERPDAYGLFTDIQTELVATTVTDEDGVYQVELPVGDYSVLVQDEDAFYCNLYGGNDELCSVTIAAGERVAFHVEINYAASY